LSGSESVRRRNGKHFTNDQLLAALSLLRPARIPIAVFFSLNLPGESQRAFRDTLVLANRICDMYPPELLRMSNMVHT